MHELITIGEIGKRKSDTKINRRTDGEEDNFKTLFTMDELQTSINNIKCKKAI